MDRHVSSFSQASQEIASQLREYHRQLRLQQSYRRQEYYRQLQLLEYHRQLQQYYRCHQQPLIDYSRLTSFLQCDDSLFPPWNWELVDDNNVSPSEESRPRLMKFQPGSFFSYDVLDAKFGNMDLEEVIDGGPNSTNISNYDDGSSSIEIDDYEEISSHSNLANTSDHEDISKSIDANHKETSKFVRDGDEEEDGEGDEAEGDEEEEEEEEEDGGGDEAEGDEEEDGEGDEAEGDEEEEEEEEEDGEGDEAEGDEVGDGDGKEKEDEDGGHDEEEDGGEDWVKIEKKSNTNSN